MRPSKAFTWLPTTLYEEECRRVQTHVTDGESIES